MRRFWLLLAALLFVPALSIAFENWERFRGPNGTGVSASKKIPMKFSDKQGVIWKTPLAGIGNSSPVIWNNRLFLHSSAGDGSTRTLACLDTETGKEVWKKNFSGAKAKTHIRNTLASCTPATDGERVYSLIWDGQAIALYAHDFQGKEIWKRDLGGYTSQHGPGHSPIVVGNKVLFNNDQDGSAQLMALDAKTGKTVWEMPRKAFRACYSTPCLNATANGVELLVTTTAGITSYNPDSGLENWNYTWTFSKMPLRTVASPVVAGGVVFACSGDGAGDRHLIAVRLGGKGDVTATNLAWENRKIFPYVPSMLGYGEYLFSVNDKGQAMCNLAATGKEVWSERLESPVTASPLLVDGKIMVFSETGEVYIYSAAADFKLLNKNSMGEPISATPAIANDRLFLRGKNHLFCIGSPAN
ncbi:MAG: hypothetical protein EXR99_10220 [Gemmataceae bacterium]|nr:hypothetical protein [Gemmataceae bacterium]